MRICKVLRTSELEQYGGALRKQQQEPGRAHHSKNGHVANTAPVEDVDRVCRQHGGYAPAAHDRAKTPLPTRKQLVIQTAQRQVIDGYFRHRAPSKKDGAHTSVS
jgi:hypothetical protein